MNSRPWLSIAPLTRNQDYHLSSSIYYTVVDVAY